MPTSCSEVTDGSRVPIGFSGAASPASGVDGGSAVARGCRRRRRAAVQADPLGQVAHRVRVDRGDVGRDRGRGIDQPVAVDGVGARRRPRRAPSPTMRLITFAASSSGWAARTSATMPATIGVAPLVPLQVT